MKGIPLPSIPKSELTFPGVIVNPRPSILEGGPTVPEVKSLPSLPEDALTTSGGSRVPDNLDVNALPGNKAVEVNDVNVNNVDLPNSLVLQKLPAHLV